MIGCCIEGLLYHPTLFHSAPCRLVRNGEQSASFRQAHAGSIDEYANGLSRVVALPLCRSPYAIFRTISNMIFNPLDGMLVGWFRSHISKKILERAPSFTNSNAPGTIVVKVLIASVQAAVSHAVPCAILRRHFTALRMSMCFANASATLCVAIREVIRIGKRGASAITSTKPLRLSEHIIRSARDCDQSSIALMCPVYE